MTTPITTLKEEQSNGTLDEKIKGIKISKKAAKALKKEQSKSASIKKKGIKNYIKAAKHSEKAAKHHAKAASHYHDAAIQNESEIMRKLTRARLKLSGIIAWL